MCLPSDATVNGLTMIRDRDRRKQLQWHEEWIHLILRFSCLYLFPWTLFLVL